MAAGRVVGGVVMTPPLSNNGTVARVEWSELSGEEAETVLANLIYNEHPAAVHLRPSQGDYGIDIVVPVPGHSSQVDVYQVKRYAQNLTTKQKRDIEESFARLLTGLAKRGIPVRNWYLVTPLDPTVNNYFTWFTAMADKVIAELFDKSDKNGALLFTDEEKATISAWRQDPGRIIHWEGRPFCTALAAKHGHVVDYYLHGGAERLRSAFAEVHKILHRDMTLPDSTTTDSEVAILTPADLHEHLSRLQKVLDTDPHFRYGISLDPRPVPIVEEPALIAATQETQPDGATLTFRIYQRFSEALNERPIPFNLRFAVSEANREAFDAWRKYGKPSTMPAKVDIDLPGGLGVTAAKLTHVRVTPIGNQHCIRMRIRRPDGQTSPELMFFVTSSTGLDGQGVWTHGIDESGYAAVEFTLDVETRSGSMSFKHKGFVDEEVAPVLPSLEFFSELHGPNVIQIAQRYGQFYDFHPAPGEAAIIPSWAVDYIRALATIQTRTSTPITIPDLDDQTSEDLRGVTEAAALIEGKVIVQHWESMTIDNDYDNPIDTSVPYQIAFETPLTVTVGGQEFTLGAAEMTLIAATFHVEGDLIHAVPVQGNNTAHLVFHSDRPLPDLAVHSSRANHLPLAGNQSGETIT